MVDSISSPNFAFLAKHDGLLVRHAALAERYVFDDANTALIKLRQFSELLAQHAAANTGIAVEESDSQLKVLDLLWDSRIIDARVSQLFHGLRKAGNLAVHDHIGDRREALHQLQMARKLGIWLSASQQYRVSRPEAVGLGKTSRLTRSSMMTASLETTCSITYNTWAKAGSTPLLSPSDS